MVYQSQDVLQVIEHYKQLNKELKEDVLTLEEEERHLRARATIFQMIAKEQEIAEAVQEDYDHYSQELTVVEQYLKEKKRAYNINELIIEKLKQLL